MANKIFHVSCSPRLDFAIGLKDTHYTWCKTTKNQTPLVHFA